jgi:hypothetical protein
MHQVSHDCTGSANRALPLRLCCAFGCVVVQEAALAAIFSTILLARMRRQEKA